MEAISDKKRPRDGSLSEEEVNNKVSRFWQHVYELCLSLVSEPHDMCMLLIKSKKESMTDFVGAIENASLRVEFRSAWQSVCAWTDCALRTKVFNSISNSENCSNKNSLFQELDTLFENSPLLKHVFGSRLLGPTISAATEITRKEIEYALKGRFPLVEASIFGSMYTGISGPGSDVDLYVNLHKDDNDKFNTSPEETVYTDEVKELRSGCVGYVMKLQVYSMFESCVMRTWESVRNRNSPIDDDAALPRKTTHSVHNTSTPSPDLKFKDCLFVSSAAYEILRCYKSREHVHRTCLSMCLDQLTTLSLEFGKSQNERSSNQISGNTQKKMYYLIKNILSHHVCESTEDNRSNQQLLRHQSAHGQQKHGKSSQHQRNTKRYSHFEVVARARIGLVRCLDTKTDIPIDITLTKSMSFHNSRLITLYLNLDNTGTLRKYVIAVKEFASVHMINKASNGSISSYGWVVMALHMLLHFRLIPCIELTSCPELLFTSLSSECERPVAPPVLSSYQTQWWSNRSVTELLYAFFYFYTHVFDRDTHIVHLRANTYKTTQYTPPLTVSQGGCVVPRKAFYQLYGLTADGDIIKTQHMPSFLCGDGDAALEPNHPLLKEQCSWVATKQNKANMGWRFSIEDPIERFDGPHPHDLAAAFQSKKMQDKVWQTIEWGCEMLSMVQKPGAVTAASTALHLFCKEACNPLPTPPTKLKSSAATSTATSTVVKVQSNSGKRNKNRNKKTTLKTKS